MSGTGHPRIAPRALFCFLWRALPSAGSKSLLPELPGPLVPVPIPVCGEPQLDTAHLWLTSLGAEDAKNPFWEGNSLKTQCFSCPELVLACFGHPKKDREGERRELLAAVYPLRVRAAYERPGHLKNSSSQESHLCTGHCSRAQFSGTLILWHLRASLEEGLVMDYSFASQ